MRFPTISFAFNRLNYQSKTGKYSIYLRIYCNGKTEYLRVKAVPKITHEEWIGDSLNGRWVSRTPINKKLREIINNARDYVEEEAMRGNLVTIKELREHFRDPDAKSTFNTFAANYVKNINQGRAKDEKRAYRTIQAYQSFLAKLDDFNPRIEFFMLTPQLVSKFNEFLSTKYNLRAVTRSKHFDKFRQIYKKAGELKLVDYNPLLFNSLELKREKPNRVSLSLDEIRKFKRTTLPDPADEHCKSIFLLMILTGLYYNDLRSLKIENLKRTVIERNNEKVTVDYIEGSRNKNKERFVIPIFQDAMTILKKYSTIKAAGTASSDPLFPDLQSEQKFNKRLKKVASDLNIEKNISIKTGRHTFGEMMVAFGNSRELVGKALAHTKEQTTPIYSDLSVENSLRGWIEPEI